MKKAIGAVAAVLGVSLVAFLGFVSTQPATLAVERHTTVAAGPADVFPFLSDYDNWGAWDPWRGKDPEAKIEVSDPSAGVGAWSSWEGNDDLGAGKQTITAVVENEKVVQELVFIRPFESKATVTLALTPEGDDTLVSWSFVSKQDFMGKMMGVFMDMDAMIGPDFESGLAKLKVASERAQTARLVTERLTREQAAAEAAALLAGEEGRRAQSAAGFSAEGG